MKSNLINISGYAIVFSASFLYYHNVLTPEFTFDWQIRLLCLLVVSFELIYRYTKRHIEQVPVSALKEFLGLLCIVAITLSSFSQTELQQLGFNFATDEIQAISQYFWLKFIFFVVSVTIVPRLFRV
ncbi:hypothetical protein KZ473_06125 [Glaesserella parasuis]|nr:hypothetical protein [Glaesserella parasuis]MCT8834451.1 hypothetical protein [Glaesserella parasuis]